MGILEHHEKNDIKLYVIEIKEDVLPLVFKNKSEFEKYHNKNNLTETTTFEDASKKIKRYRLSFCGIL